MVIFIEGGESFLAQQIIRQLKEKYLAKNPDGVELIDIDASERPINWADLQAAPLFAQSRLVVIRQAGSLLVGEQESLGSYLGNLPATTVAVLWDGKSLKKGKLLDSVTKPGVKRISAAPLTGTGLARYIETRSKHHALTLTSEQKRRLADELGANLWALETELSVMALGVEQQQGKDKASEPFAFYRAVANGNWAQAKKLALQDHAAGVPIELLVGSVASALRKNKSIAHHDQVVATLCDIDVGLKTGLLDEATAVALLRADLPIPRQKRVVWEELWEETQGG